MTEQDPRRLLEEETGMLRDALEVSREELPSDEQLGSLAAKLGPLLGGGPGGGAPTGGGGGAVAGAGTSASAPAGLAATGTVLGKAALALLAAGAVATGTWMALDEDPAGAPPSPAESPVSTPVETPTPPDDAPPTPPTPSETPTNPTPENLPGRFQDPPRKRPGRFREAVVPGEVGLLQRAQDALAGEPSRALALAEEHRRHHPEGMLAQEREVLAIDALVRLGRREAAEARAERFRRRYPRSAQLRRIETLLE